MNFRWPLNAPLQSFGPGTHVPNELGLHVLKLTKSVGTRSGWAAGAGAAPPETTRGRGGGGWVPPAGLGVGVGDGLQDATIVSGMISCPVSQFTCTFLSPRAALPPAAIWTATQSGLRRLAEE